MNIFKVFASSKKSFPEECMSALILWLLNPQMEHGLGYEFLQRFIQKLEEKDPKLTSLERRLVSQLRKSSQDKEGDQCGCEDVLCDLETHVTSDTGEAFIDAVLEFSDTILAIENKIYTNSASDFTQLCREYDGLRNAATRGKIKIKRRIVLIFLVPGDVDVTSMDEWRHKPDVQDGDSIQIGTWKENDQGYPSVYTLISELLRDEAGGRTEPIPEYTRHTLKALNAFICNDFQGYYYKNHKKPTSIGGLNPLAEGTENIQLLLGKTEGYVGVRFGINGFIFWSMAEMSF